MIKNLIFDVGDVLIEYRWLDMFMQHGLSEAEAIRIGTEMFQSEIWWKRLDGGLISHEEAVEEYRSSFPDDISDIEWCMNHGSLMAVHRPEVWDRIMKLKAAKGYKIYLLSNYSKRLLNEHIGNTVIPEFIDGGIISYQIKHIKPEPEIYTALLDKYRLIPDECIFFDDRPKNAEGARYCGMHSVIVTSREQLNNELDNFLLKNSM